MKKFTETRKPNFNVQTKYVSSSAPTKHVHNVGKWTISTEKTAILNQKQLEKLESDLKVHQLPEMIFNSKLELQHKDTNFKLHFNAVDALHFAKSSILKPFRDKQLPNVKVGHAWDPEKKKKDFEKSLKVKKNAIIQSVGPISAIQKKKTDPLVTNETSATTTTTTDSTIITTTTATATNNNSNNNNNNTLTNTTTTTTSSSSSTTTSATNSNVDVSTNITGDDYVTVVKTKGKENVTTNSIQVNETIEEREDNIDWTFTTIYKGSIENERKIELNVADTINYERLKRRDPILFYDDILLFEDELHDNGISHLNVKTRVMKDYFFCLMRFFLRVDNVLIRMIDCRFYHEFNTGYILREFSIKHITYQALKQKSPSLINDIQLLSDPARIEPMLMTIEKHTDKIHII